MLSANGARNIERTELKSLTQYWQRHKVIFLPNEAICKVKMKVKVLLLLDDDCQLC